MRWVFAAVLGAVLLYGCDAPRSVVSAPTSAKAATMHAAWKVVAPGVALREFQSRATAQDASTQIVALRCAPKRIRFVVGAKTDAAQWRQKNRAIAAVNGGFFDPEGRSLGLRIAQNKRVSDLHPADWGVFFVRGTRARIVHTRDYRALRDGGKTRRVLEAIQCGPRLVVDNRLTKLKAQWARRTAMGIDRDGQVVVAISDGELSFAAWQKVWRDDLRCPNALGLDGGGSTQLSLKVGKTAREIGGLWPVPDALLIR